MYIKRINRRIKFREASKLRKISITNCKLPINSTIYA